MPQLSDFYDGDARRADPAVRDLAAKIRIPHPLSNVQYADGISRCTHSKNHQRFDYCPQAARPAPAENAQLLRTQDERARVNAEREEPVDTSGDNSGALGEIVRSMRVLLDERSERLALGVLLLSARYVYPLAATVVLREDDEDDAMTLAMVLDADGFQLDDPATSTGISADIYAAAADLVPSSHTWQHYATKIERTPLYADPIWSFSISTTLAQLRLP